MQMLLSHSIHSSGARLGGTSAPGEPPLTIPLIVFMQGVKVEIELILMQDLLDWI